MSNPLIYVDLYQSRPRKLLGRKQNWRWRALSGDNQRKMASGGEAYTNAADAISAIRLLFGTGTNVYLRQREQGNELLRLATPTE